MGEKRKWCYTPHRKEGHHARSPATTLRYLCSLDLFFSLMMPAVVRGLALACARAHVCIAVQEDDWGSEDREEAGVGGMGRRRRSSLTKPEARSRAGSSGLHLLEISTKDSADGYQGVSVRGVGGVCVWRDGRGRGVSVES